VSTPYAVLWLVRQVQIVCGRTELSHPSHSSMNPSFRRRDHVLFALDVRDYAIDIRLTHRSSHLGSTDYPCGNYIRAERERITGGRDDDAMKREPVYEEYAGEQKKVGDQKLAIIQDYAKDFMTMDDAKADELAQRVMAFERAANGIAKEILPGHEEGAADSAGGAILPTGQPGADAH